MKKLIVVAVFFALMLPCEVMAKLGNVSFTATTAGGSIHLGARNYTIINDGANNFFWNCSNQTPGITSASAHLAQGERLEVDDTCHTMIYDTTTGDATIRIFYQK